MLRDVIHRQSSTGESDGIADTADPRERNERGIALVWVGGCLFLLLIAAGFAIDLIHAYVVGQRAQNAADAGALAGTIFLPDEPTTAKVRAAATVNENGFTSGGGTVITTETVNENASLQPTQIRVEVKTEVPTLFARVMGFGSVHVNREATADYDNPVTTGSPSNTMGNQPDCTAPCTTGDSRPDFWLNIAGPKSRKGNGDRFQANTCSGGQTDNCSSANDDYDSDGYLMVVRNDTAGATLQLDGFDPGFVNVGDNCAANDNGSHLDDLYNNTLNARYQYVIDRTNPSDPGWPYCTGDQWFTPDDNQGPWTTYRFYEPDITPEDISDNVEITSCAREFEPYWAYDYDGDGDVDTLWNRYQAEIAPSSTLTPLVSQYFRNWVPLCTVTNAAVGEYVIQMQTNRHLDGSSNGEGAGHNRFSLRVAQDGSLSSPDVRMYAVGKLPMYANATGADTRFHLARVLPGSANRNLRLVFFDVGDASDVGTLTVIPPTDSNYTSFPNCTYTAPTGNTSGPPFGTPAATGGGCSVGGVSSASWNRQVIEWVIPIPSDYTCNYNDPAGCWIKMKFQYAATTRVSDTTTWSATLDGNPVRIIG